MIDAPSGTTGTPRSAAAAGLRATQMAWLAAAVISVSAGYGALMPVLAGWLGSMMPGATATEIARHVGFFTGVYAAGVLFGALLWGALSNRIGRGRILIIGLVGYVASLLLLLIPTFTGLWGLYAVRAATGFFVAAVVPVVSALVAEHTPVEKRARRFAWLSAMSLLGFLFGPAIIQAADWVGTLAGMGPITPATSARNVIVLSAVLGTVLMHGLIQTLPAKRQALAQPSGQPEVRQDRTFMLCGLTAVVMLVLAAFELGIVLQGLQHDGMTTRQVALMFAECSLVMLVVNATLFFTGWLEKIAARMLIGIGLALAAAGLAVMAWHGGGNWLYLGVSLASGGTGLVLPVIAYLAAGAAHLKLGFTMGALAAAAAAGQALGSVLGGALFGAMGQTAFGLMILPLAALFALLLLRPQALTVAQVS